ncbi:6484_t:CDS:1, partial [Racocetra persica]
RKVNVVEESGEIEELVGIEATEKIGEIEEREVVEMWKIIEKQKQ